MVNQAVFTHMVHDPQAHLSTLTPHRADQQRSAT